MIAEDMKMKKSTRAIVVSLVPSCLLAAPLTALAGERLNVTVTDVTTAEALETADERTVFSLDQVLVASGRGVLDGTTARCLALEVAENATGGSVTEGFCTFVDADGDKIFEEFEIERDSLNAEATGSGLITGGTGKYDGISGNVTHTRMLLLPGPKEGVFPGIGTISGRTD